METSKHLYKEGNYRFWLDTETGSLRIKFDGNKELYTIPKNTKLYDRLMEDFFSKAEQEEK